MGARSLLGMHLLFPNSPSLVRPQGICPGFGSPSPHAVFPHGHPKLAPGRTSSSLPTPNFSYLKLFSTCLSTKLPLLQDASLHLALLFPLSPS